MIRTPPREFVSALRAFDPLLRLRWAPRRGAWFIERKMEPRAASYLKEQPNPWRNPLSWDLFDGWKEGYVHVLTVPAEALDHTVFAALAEADAWRQGGMAALNRMLDAREAAWEQATDRQIDHFLQAATSETFDLIQWRDGNRIALRAPEPPPAERRDGYLVRERRRLAERGEGRAVVVPMIAQVAIGADSAPGDHAPTIAPDPIGLAQPHVSGDDRIALGNPSDLDSISETQFALAIKHQGAV